jgi:Phosphotransferase enzyme family
LGTAIGAQMGDREDLDPLIAHIVTRPPPGAWRGWEIAPIAGGANNLVYRATSAEHDLAIKLMRRDARDRAGREYTVLAALAALGLDLAPRPIMLDRDRYAHPIIVQSWIAGAVHDPPPADDAEWEALLRHYAAIHSVTPEQLDAPLAPAVINMGSVAQGRAMVAAQLGLLPDEARPPDLPALVELAQRANIPEPGGARTALCRVDANTRNFVRRAGHAHGWASVDWENSGWGEPAFEIVDLMTHPAYRDVDDQRWRWVAERYAALSGDPHAPDKIAALYPLMLAWWAARTARLIYELPRGIDVRLGLVEWGAGLGDQYLRYRDLASAALARYHESRG